ncbi:DNA polymerase ligase N-terminal domain-containing protein [Streptomyces sp. Je 1-369]|uniref:DNA polymerase ligase N-terminal domain-containing protein n=1 Tax=Streptomyces sp. Je 1-369 TaxID=2966192 RepID=UPI0022867BB4|nr:DNA polymerase ligase N-terminal domain-containing protein [Streptomyces sp. Je 1-369]WAL98641.1 3'-phosphoesterase [Streptomyces sp. Je 1-369]
MSEKSERNGNGKSGNGKSGKDALRTYRGKRHFGRTAEPSGEHAALDGDERAARDGAGEAADDEPSFVVQIHDASTMHFDFRLEVDGVLKSWSVPKGPSTDPQDKRLAIPTEDHPLDYRDYEGVIPEGEYGGGTVMVWDRGTYRPTSHDKQHRPVPFAQALEKGHATFDLHGEKLRGQYALTRFHGREEQDASSGGSAKPTWLLVRTGHHSGGGTPDPRRARSARSGRTLRQIAEQG